MQHSTAVPALTNLTAPVAEARRGFAVLDTAPESAFEDLLQLARQVCGVPAAAFSLGEVARQWFRARVAGPGGPESLFCVPTATEGDVLVVPDTRADARFASHPLVLGEAGVRFYAALALRAADGSSLGALCVMDRQPRQLGPAQVDGLRALGRVAVAQLELRRALTEAVGTLGAHRDGPPVITVEEAERRAIESALRRSRGNLSEAVRLLKIGRTTLYRKLRQYNLDPGRSWRSEPGVREVRVAPEPGSVN